jgi:4-amino-4-deoxy-L-arabinose transferase-like glycosyltransferase
VDKPYRVSATGMLAMVWDESLHGILSQETLESGRFIVTTYNGEPDDFFRKPPLGLWLIATSYQPLGYAPLALRLPSALCALAGVELLMAVAKSASSVQV